MSRISSPPKNVFFISQIILTRAHFVVLKEKPSNCKEKQRRNDDARPPHVRADRCSVTPTLLENKNKPGNVRDGDHANLLHTNIHTVYFRALSVYNHAQRKTSLVRDFEIWYVNILKYTFETCCWMLFIKTSKTVFRLWNCSSQPNCSVVRQCHLLMPLIKLFLVSKDKLIKLDSKGIYTVTKTAF